MAIIEIVGPKLAVPERVNVHGGTFADLLAQVSSVEVGHTRYLQTMIGRRYYGILAALAGVRDRAYEVPGRLFDAWNGVDTCGMVQVRDLVIPEEARPHAVRYQPTKLAVFSHLLRRLPIKDRSRFAFVDFGCGKGRCLLLAARAGFEDVRGVDLSEPLTRIARQNADRFIRGRHASAISIQCTDAAAAALPDRPGVYFFYNPFDEPSMAATVDRIARHLTKTGYEAYAVYVNPRHPSVFDQAGFRLLETGRRREENWAIWHFPASIKKQNTKAA